MLVQALQNHNKATQPVAPIKKPSQQSATQQSTIQTGFKSYRPTDSETGRSGTSRSTSISSSAKSSITGFIDSSFTRKRLADTNDNLMNKLNNFHGFQEPTLPTAIESAQASSIAALHDAIYFEDDFDDDLDFELDEPVLPPTLKAAAAAIPSGTPTKSSHFLPKLDNGRIPPSSSAGEPLPWSSSPVSHFQQPIPAARRPPTQVFSQEALSKQRSTEYTSSAKAPVTKPAVAKPPRTLPFKKEQVKEEPIEWASKTTANKRKSKESALAKTVSKRSKPEFPWDTTMSAYKAGRNEVKGFNAAQKRTVSTVASDDVGLSLRTKKEKVPVVFLSEEQRSVLTLVVEGSKSAFFTGSAGTGKSVLLREIISQLRRKYSKESDRVAVTASTGLAACNIGGVTLHSFGGIGLGKEAPADLVRKIKRNPKAKNRWLRTKVLIIDEISMVDGELFDKLEAVARLLRNNGRPFGGIQLVITGDFFQLPPVPDSGKISKFAFEADTWNTCIEHTIGLTQVFRQKDPAFAAVLNEMRLGNLSKESCELFSSLRRPLEYMDGLEATELFPTRNEVDRANNNRMSVLPGEIVTYHAEDTGTITDRVQRDKLLSNCMAPPRIDLKMNAQVMLIKNVDETLVNGSLGRVIGFMNEKTFALLEDGMLDINEALDELGEDFEGEDALQRRQRKIKARILAQQIADTSRKWPLVQFTVPDGTTRQLLVQPEAWKIELPNGEVQAARNQLPLILAWALSIHKAQGQTLERVKVDLGKVFEKGQAYVALSRATCQEGLQVLRFDASKVRAHDKVRTFYNSLYKVTDALKRTAPEKMKVAAKMTSNFDDYAVDSDEGGMRMVG